MQYIIETLTFQFILLIFNLTVNNRHVIKKVYNH